MANNITLFKKYIDMLDEVYKLASTTSAFDGDNSLVQMGANAGEFLVPKMSMQGLGNYSRNEGYSQGDVTLEMETVKCNYDRGRKFVIDAMDNEETAGIAFGKLASEFIRTQVVPEMDAFRYASMAALAKTKTEATLTGGEDVLKAILAATTAMDEAEVPAEQRHLRITPTLLNSVKALDTTKSREALQGFASIVAVPQSRFYTVIDLKDGKTSSEPEGGFAKDTTGKDINFMIIHKPAVMQYTKHTVNKIITPEANQTSDGWMFFYRAYGLSDVYENKTAGVYLHSKAGE